MNNGIVNAAGALIYISIACTLVMLLLRKSVFASAIKYVCGLCMLITVMGILSPLMKSISDITLTIPDSNEEDIDSEFQIDGTITSESARYICGYIKTAISQRFGIDKESISVSVTLDTDGKDGVMIKSVTVCLPKTESDIYSSVAEYISDLVGSGCIVIPKE